MGIKIGETDITAVKLGSADASPYIGSTPVGPVSGPDYLTFEAVEATNINFAEVGSLSTLPVLEYRANLSSDIWTAYTIGNSISLTAGQKCQFRGDNEAFSESAESYINFTSTGLIKASGTLRSLLDKTCESVSAPSNFCFFKLFAGCSALLTAPKLLIIDGGPSGAYVDACYMQMFRDCTSLKVAPSIPATKWTGMDYFPYHRMFRGCTSLETIPNLLNSDVALYASGLFYGCTSLQISDTQTAEAPYVWRVPKDEVFTWDEDYNVEGIFTGCLGTRSSDDMSLKLGKSNTYYTQHEPI